MMHPSVDKLPILRELIVKLYARPFDEALALDACSTLGRLVDAQYYAFVSFPNSKGKQPSISSNNPPEFTPLYNALIDQDFFMGHVVETCREYVWRRDPEFGSEHQNRFTLPFQPFRPVGDTADFPLMSEGALRGYWAFCRAGVGCESFSDDELGLMRFCVAFMDDAFRRFLLPTALDEDIAYLDYRGQVVGAGAKIQEAFDELFGRGAPLAVSGERAERRLVFLGSYRRFLAGPFAVGMDRRILSCGNRRYAFLFSLLRSAESSLRQDGMPFATVTLLGSDMPGKGAAPAARIALQTRFQFTSRELEVLYGIYAGKSNKEIAAELKVDEGTVKRHSHGIYEKTGFHSRVELVLGLSLD